MKSRLKKQQESKSILAYFLFFLLCAALNVVFSCLCVYTSTQKFIANNKTLFCTVLLLLWNTVYGISIHFLHKNNKRVLRALVIGYAFFSLLFIFIYVGQKTQFFTWIKTPEKLEEFIKRAGWWMPVIFICLQYLQVTVLPIPSIVSTLVGVALFGAWQATVYSFIGIFIGSLTAFFLGRRLGKKAVAWVLGKEELSKWQVKLKGKDKLLLTAMFLLPMFPDDVLCFVAGLSTMSNCYFIIMIAITRLISIVASCYSFEFIPFNTWWGISIWGVLFVLLIAICVIFYKNADKINDKIKKISKEIGERKNK